MGTPNIFESIPEPNVTFLIDTSGSMYCRLHIVKQDLKEQLSKMAYAGDRKFNLVEFNSEVTQLSNKMIKCLPETVKVAADWIATLEAKTGTNTESALLAAYNDEECDAIYMVTDGLPDSKPSDILDRVAYVCHGRPVHCIYLTGPTVDKAATNFLQDLATETFGSFHIVTVTNHGSVERITPVYKASHAGTGVIRTTDRQVYSGTQKQCSITTTIDNPPAQVIVSRRGSKPVVANPYALPIVAPDTLLPVPPYGTIMGPHPAVTYPWPNWIPPAPRVYTDENGRALKVPYLKHAWMQWYQPYLWARYRTAKSWLNMSKDLDKGLSDMSLSPAAGAMLIDQLVLARRVEDGLYYKGTVKSQISNDKFLVEFSPCQEGKYTSTTYQETFIFDIVQLNDAKRHSIMKGDKVLAPFGVNDDLFCPGVVINGQEGRESNPDMANQELIVSFENSRSASVAPGKAIWIDQLLYDRTAFELKLPKKVRQQIADTVADYPEDSFPGYPISGPDRDPEVWEMPRKLYAKGRDATYQPDTGLIINKENFEDYSSNLKNFSQRSSYTQEEIERKIPGTEFTKQQLEDKVGAQIEAHQFELDLASESRRKKMLMERKHYEAKQGVQRYSDSKEQLERDISILEAELKYKMQLREKALDQQRAEIDSEIERKIREREALVEERRLLLRQPPSSHLSRSREQLGDIHRERSRSLDRSLERSVHRSRTLSRDRSLDRTPRRYHSRSQSPSPRWLPVDSASRSSLGRTSRPRHRAIRSRSRSLSTERSPSYGRRSLSRHRSLSRSRSLSPSNRERSVDFNESLNRKYYYSNEYYTPMFDSGYSEGSLRDSATNTPIIRNGRVIKLKKNKDEKPPWKYWKSEPVPDVIGPNIHEPYNQTAVAEPLELRDSRISVGPVEWSSSHFGYVVPNGRTNYDRFLCAQPTGKSVSFQDNAHVQLASGSNLVKKASKKEKMLQFRQNEAKKLLSDPTKYYIHGDGVGDSLKDFYKERVAAQMQREQQRTMHSQKPIQSNSHMGDQSQSNGFGTYEKQLKATSYRREVAARNESMNNLSPQQKKIITMSAKRQERDMLRAAQLAQKENNSQENINARRAKAVMRNNLYSQQFMTELAKEKVIKGLGQQSRVMTA